MHEFTVGQNPLFIPEQRFQLAKLNLFYGKNATGKTALIEWITGFFDPEKFSRWMIEGKSPIRVEMSVLNPKLQHLAVTVSGNDIACEIDGAPCAFLPLAGC